MTPVPLGAFLLEHAVRFTASGAAEGRVSFMVPMKPSRWSLD